MGNVLLIEGHRQMRTALKDLLARNGCRAITEAEDPIEGIRQVIGNRPPIIILDTAWPEVNGVWLTRVFRLLAPETKILLLLEDNRHDYQEAARLSGADAFLARSALATELTPLLSRWLTTIPMNIV